MRKDRKFLNAAFLVDGYKVLHHMMYPEGTEIVFSNFTARSNKYATIKGANSVVVGVIQYVLADLVDRFDREFFLTSERIGKSPEDLLILKKTILDEIEREFTMYTGMDYGIKHFSKLWDLGYLPVEIRSMDEGLACPIKVPYFTIHNTHKEFFWVTNYLETIISNMVWPGITSATTTRGMRNLVDKWAIKTTGTKEGTDYQLHDFSMRGLKGVDNTVLSGIGFLMSSHGTDNIPAIPMIRWAYGDEGNIGNGVAATEHSIMTSEGEDGEFGIMENLIEKFPNGFLSVVSDSYDYWRNLTEYLPRLKDRIMARDGRYVARPDSGNVIDIICGTVKDVYPDQDIKKLTENLKDDFWDFFTSNIDSDGYIDKSDSIIKVGDKYYHVIASADIGTTHDHNDNDHYFVDDVKIIINEVTATPEMKGSIEVLWDIFGGTENDLGYKILDSHIGLIYGESINYETANTIFTLLELKGFASTNVVLGCGSFLYSMTSRDSYGQAIKSTFQVRNGVGKNIYKDPKTDDGTKKSAKGLLVVRDVEGVPTLFQEQTWEDVASSDNMLKIRFKDGEFFNQDSFETIRKRTSEANIL